MKLLPGCLFLLALLPEPLSAQVSQWAAGFGAEDRDSAFSLAIDRDGNVIVAGDFSGTVDFDPGPDTYFLTAPGPNPDAFFIKLDSTGRLVWALAFGDFHVEHATAVNVDALGNVYCVGDFAGSLDFDPGPGEAILTALGSWDTFIVKLDREGQFLWARSVGGQMTEISRFATVDSEANIFVGGLFQGLVDFDPGPAVYNLMASEGYFALKLDSDGQFAWARMVDNSLAATTDDAGNLYLTGITSEGGGEMFVSEILADGSLAWRRTIVSWGRAYGIVRDNDGNIAVTGEFGGSNDFDPGPGFFDLPSYGLGDIFLLKLDAGGNFLWARSVGSIGFDSGRGIDSNTNGDLYIAGDFEGSVDFDPGPDTAILTGSGSVDVFSARFDRSGNYLWAAGMGGEGVQQIWAAKRGLSGQLVIAGEFQGPVDFDPGPGVILLQDSGHEDAFVAQFAAPGPPIQEIPALSSIGLVLLTVTLVTAGIIALRLSSPAAARAVEMNETSPD